LPQERPYLCDHALFIYEIRSGHIGTHGFNPNIRDLTVWLQQTVYRGEFTHIEGYGTLRTKGSAED
jgi:hypothetical protein